MMTASRVISFKDKSLEDKLSARGDDSAGLAAKKLLKRYFYIIDSERVDVLKMFSLAQLERLKQISKDVPEEGWQFALAAKVLADKSRDIELAERIGGLSSLQAIVLADYLDTVQFHISERTRQGL